MTCRPPGPGGMIPWTAVYQYGAHKRLHRDVIDLLWVIVGKMDAIERQWVAERTKRPTPDKPGGERG